LIGWLLFAICGSNVSDSLSRPHVSKRAVREKKILASRWRGSYFD